MREFADIINVLFFNGKRQVRRMNWKKRVQIPVIKQTGNYMHRKGTFRNIDGKGLCGLRCMAWKTRQA